MAKAWLLRLSALAIFACLLLVPQNLSAQGCTPKVAEPVIYGPSLCSGANFGSTAYIDASVFYNSGKYGDICGTINAILLGETSPAYPTAGAVIDARGILQAPPVGSNDGLSIPCTTNPFLGVSVPSTVLLPATNIQISKMWKPPSNTRIIGDNPTPGAPKPGSNVSTLQVQNGFSDLAMIEMCPSGTCTGISIEHIAMNAQEPTGTQNILPVYGIYNLGAQDQSYVDDVNLQNFEQAGIFVATTAQGSGPYSHINFGAASQCSSSTNCPACVVLQSQTRGVHGATCIGSSAVSQKSGVAYAAIYVQASNNSIRDIHVEDFWDGVQVGGTTAISPSVNNVVIANVTAANNGTGSGGVVNTVHICGQYGSTYGTCTAPVNAVSDVTATGISIEGNQFATWSALRDDVTGTTIAPPSGSSSTIWLSGSYILGDQIGTSSVQYNRFSTSPAVPSWGVGAISVSAGATCPAIGALYSNTKGASGSTVYVCTTSGWEDLY